MKYKAYLATMMLAAAVTASSVPAYADPVSYESAASENTEEADTTESVSSSSETAEDSGTEDSKSVSSHSDEETETSASSEDPDQQTKEDEKSVNELTMTQGTENATEGSSHSYTISYHTEHTKGKTESIHFSGNGKFQISTIHSGTWENYKGKIRITAGNEAHLVDPGTDVTLDAPADEVTIVPETIGEEAVSVSDLRLTGTIGTGAGVFSPAADVTVDGSVAARSTVNTTIIDEHSIPAPTLSGSPASLSYDESGKLQVNGIGSLSAKEISDYTVKVSIPDEVFVDSLVLPQFDGASYELRIDGTKYPVLTGQSSVYINRYVHELTLSIHPSRSVFSQTADLQIEFSNLTQADTSVSASANVHVTFADGVEKSVDSNTVSFALSALVKPVEPTEPTEPTTPTEPTEPTTPTEPTEPTKPTKPTTPTEPVKPSNGGTTNSNEKNSGSTENHDSSRSSGNTNSSNGTDNSNGTQSAAIITTPSVPTGIQTSANAISNTTASGLGSKSTGRSSASATQNLRNQLNSNNRNTTSSVVDVPETELNSDSDGIASADETNPLVSSDSSDSNPVEKEKEENKPINTVKQTAKKASKNRAVQVLGIMAGLVAAILIVVRLMLHQKSKDSSGSESEDTPILDIPQDQEQQDQEQQDQKQANDRQDDPQNSQTAGESEHSKNKEN